MSTVATKSRRKQVASTNPKMSTPGGHCDEDTIVIPPCDIHDVLSILPFPATPPPRPAYILNSIAFPVLGGTVRVRTFAIDPIDRCQECPVCVATKGTDGRFYCATGVVNR